MTDRDELILKLHAQGVAKAEIARRAGCSRQTVYDVLGAHRDAVVVGVLDVPTTKREAKQLGKVNTKAAEANLDILGQLGDINDRAWGLANAVSMVTSGVFNRRDAAVLIRTLGEIRKQLELQAKLIEMLHNTNAIREFQDEVLRAVCEVDPDVARRIRERLAERRALRGTLERDRQHPAAGGGH